MSAADDTSSVEALIELFTRVGIDPTRASVTVKNQKFASALAATIREAGVEGGAEKAVGVMLDSLAGGLGEKAVQYRPFVAQKIVKRDIKTDEQLQGINWFGRYTL